ncbi:MAG TPA: AraC family transcriptional regulator, partial [Usitatibacteraceae bacterium]|nr:AraC family transcriptional regulator [Usitatibacteraceae bacterium]
PFSAMDALSEVLRLASLTGHVLADATAGGAWCVAVPAASSRAFAHVVLEGECTLQAGDSGPIALRAGDVAFAARGEGHLLGSDLSIEPTPFAALLRPPVAGELAPVTLGGTGRRTRWVTLAISADRHLAEPLFASLPPVLKASLRGTAPLGWLSDSLGLCLSGSDAPRPGGAAALSRVAELVLIEALRRHVEELPPGGSGWLAALNDRYVGAALALVHGRPGEHWTVERLARQVGLSRSALAERFSLVVGEPIFGFLTRVRLQLAAHKLATTTHSIEAIAEGAGYEAVSSFSRAFKRTFGKPPTVWRRKSRRRRPALA